MLLKEDVRVEEERAHLELSVHPAPLALVAVPVELDPVALGVVEVERLAHEVVGAAGEAPRLRTGDGVHGGGERLLGVEQNRGVEEAGVARARVLELGRVLEHDDRLGSAAERDTRGAGGEHLETHGVTVVASHRIQVGHPERDRTHRGVGREHVCHASMQPHGWAGHSGHGACSCHSTVPSGSQWMPQSPWS